MDLRDWQKGVDYIVNAPGCTSNDGSCVVNVPTLRGFEVIVARSLQLAVALGGLIVFIFILYGGFLWVTAGADEQKISQAQKTITYAIVGLVLMISSILILKAIEAITGVQLTTFKIFVFPTE